MPASLNDKPFWFRQQSHRPDDEVPSPAQLDCEKHWQIPVSGEDDEKNRIRFTCTEVYSYTQLHCRAGAKFARAHRVIITENCV